jgi:hypothetical protein
MKTLILILACFLIGSTLSFAEESVKGCGTMEHLKKQMKDNPELEAQMAQFEEQVQLWIKNNYKGKKQDMLQSNITIPVVVHILYCTDDQKVSDDIVRQQIEISNKDYSAQNPHPMGAFASYLKANTGIQFVLAQKTPDGKPTNGIDRHKTTVPSFAASYDAVKYAINGGVDAWDPKSYFNIWVCNLENYAGYAQFPSSGVNSTYGIVVRYSVFGPGGPYPVRSNGGVTTHEIGHCFNLRHIWGDDNGLCTGTDYVDDTPNQGMFMSGYMGGMFTDDCSNSAPGIMYMNFMDYTSDESWANFTPGQVARMQACFASPDGLLLTLLNSTAGSGPTGCETPTSIVVTFITKTSVTLEWTAMSGATSYNIRYRKTGATTWTNTSSTSNSKQITGLVKNTNYEYQIQTVTGSCSSPYSGILSFKTLNQEASSSIAAPQVIGPTDDATLLELKVTCSWNTVTNATSYILQVSESSDFSNPIQTRRASYSITVGGLDYGKTYYWRVKGCNSSYSGSWSSVRTFSTLDPALITAPVITYPEDQASQISVSPTLTWNEVTGATGYILQYSTDNFANNIVEVSVTQPSCSLSNLALSTLYYWRVKAVNGTEFSPWAYRLFTTEFQVTPVPTLLYPEDNAQSVSVNSVTFAWSPITNASYYIFQYSTDATFNTMSGGVVTANTTANVAGLSVNSTYYWRVKAVIFESNIRVYSSQWSGNYTFTTENFTLSAPVLVSPTDGVTDVSINPALNWQSVQFATGYFVQYSNDPSFPDNNIVSTNQLSVNLTNLYPAANYYWRVQAISGQTSGPWSEVWLFTTQNVNLSPPNLVTPVNNATRISTNPTLVWNPVDFAEDYTLEYSTSSSFNPPPIPVSPIYTTNTTLTGLARNTTYYWRVKAHYDGMESGWSTVFKFKTSASGKIGSDDFTAGEILSDNITLIVYPNPLSTKAHFEIQVPKSEFVNLVIYDIYGIKIATLANGQISPGIHDFEFDAKGLPSGVYYCILQAGDYSESMKLMIIQ